MSVSAAMPTSFRSRMALLFGILSLLVGAPTYLYISSVHRDQLVGEKHEALQGLATSAATVLAENLNERRREIQLLAQTPLYRRAPLDAPDINASLERIKESYPHYSWIGLADPHGVVRSATAGHLLGREVSQRPWYQAALKRMYVGDPHDAVLLAKLLKNEDPGQRMRFIDFATPVYDEQGKLRAVLGAHAHWRWAGEVLDAVRSRATDTAGIEFFIVDGQGAIIYPDQAPEGLRPPDPDTLRRAGPHAFLGWGGAPVFLTSEAAVREPLPEGGLGWRVYVRQPRASVLASVRGLQRTVLVATGLAAVAFLLLAWWGANRMSRPVLALAERARRVEQGEENVDFGTQQATEEMRVLSTALSSMAGTLLQQKHALEASNRELEDKVAARTRDLQRLNGELQLLARTDALTGLPNRLQANERLAQEFLRMKRSGEAYALCMLDIDHFKRINDQFGHAAGDTVLREVGARIRAALRETDFVARVGGEEFLLLLPATPLGAALAVAEKVRAAVAAESVAPAGRVTVSVGVQMAQELDADEDVALRRADDLLYQAKQAGRDRVAAHEAAA